MLFFFKQKTNILNKSNISLEICLNAHVDCCEGLITKTWSMKVFPILLADDLVCSFTRVVDRTTGNIIKAIDISCGTDRK